ncbi:ligand-binding sensor domain-containing protein, partial [Chitinophaga sp.]|uniref:ligand-binding sensor domain-containing protein n=1 Tax=Chitinophaga sp. TaxID=1869181 RepID=UPI002F9451C1
MRYLFGLVLLLQSLIVLSQNEHYNFSKLNTYTGLSHNQVNAVLKDPDGFLWFGTTYGLNRYDGYFCRIFHKDHNDSTSLKDNYILSLYELPERKMWVSTTGGACIYNPDTEKFNADYNSYLHSIGLPDGAIMKIVKGYDGRYWFLYNDKGLYLFSANDKSVKPFKQQRNPPAEKITSIKETKDGKLWLVYQSGLLEKYDIKDEQVSFSSTTLQKQHKWKSPFDLFIDCDGDIWLWHYNDALFLFHPQDNTIRQFGKNSFQARLNSELISQVVQDNNGLIWVGTDHGGITLIDKKNGYTSSYLLNNPNDPKSISQNSITTIYKDDQDVIWLGTYKQGVNYYNSNIVQFPYYHHRESDAKSLQFDDVNRFVEDRAGNIWIGTNGGGLIYFDRKNNTFRQYLHDPSNSNSLSNNVIVSLWIDQEGILWVGTYLGGLNSFDGRKFTHYRHNDNDSSSLADDTVWELFEDREQYLWIGTLGGGLDRFDKKTNRFNHYRSGGGLLLSNYISSLMEDRKGNLWVGANAGIAVLDKNKSAAVFYQHSNKKNSLSNDDIFCMLEDSKGRIWIGTREGLNLFNEQSKEFQTFTTANGLPDNMILNILEDDHQTLWISTPNGLCNAIPGQNNNQVTFSVISYDAANNLQSREFNDNAALKTSSGELIFGGPSGFNLINPTSIRKPVVHPTLAFTGFQILDKNVEPGEWVNDRVLLNRALSQLQSITLKYKENIFSIDFASLDFSHKDNDKYAYMLEGFNEDWLYTDGNQRRATYTNLSPGHYVFKAKVL